MIDYYGVYVGDINLAYNPQAADFPMPLNSPPTKNHLNITWQNLLILQVL